ncbi:MaoC-like domain-containing protein [Paraburkholderia unamae]|uniref:MaoC family dehydratase n=1 Tax=Paraburkholderia unamae TaxID=219649 RepID=UPI001CAEC345|nr:MaoC family dehydratase [Paraburkholderia unamae]CAG9245968.1 MaoC-like domain-containing protein [Paraburkholderia unamae]
MITNTLRNADGYFEDFEPGMLMRHARGKTVTEMDNVLITNMVMNTAEGHFNEDVMNKTPGAFVSKRVVFGGINLSMVLGLAAQDTAEQCIRELTLDKIRLTTPVLHGDTLYAFTEVLAKEDAEREDAGIVHFKHYGINQNDRLCVQAERTALIKRKSHWVKK